ncbi:peptidase MA family metallohydrolase [Nocardia sp. NPDC051570]|uniref:peptidase MA family metallohydrolase n=1 Tax=Nocardia sp. NPDC051570 TaxID=3364324 RepID=UPI0037A43DB1
MNALERVRTWLTARRRFEFVATVATVIALTAITGALVLLPKSALPKMRPEPAAAQFAAPALPADPQLAEVRRVMESYGPVVAQQVSGEDGQLSVVFGHPYQRGDVDTLAHEIGPAVDSVTALWGPDWSRAAVVVVASSSAEFAALTHATGPVSSEVAAASVSDPFLPGHRPTGQRVVFAADAGRRLGTDGLRDTLRHELTHVAARAQTIDGSPQWMLEGFAEYSAHRGEQSSVAQLAPTLTARARSGVLPTDLPADADFAPTARNNAALAYEQAWSANAFTATQFGEPKLVDLYHRLATGPQTQPTLDNALHDTLGIGHTTFVTQWRDWIKTHTA